MPQPCDLQPLFCIQAQNSGTAPGLMLNSPAGGLKSRTAHLEGFPQALCQADATEMLP